jgi:diguanylate cyclase (GGDEF)-like protein
MAFISKNIWLGFYLVSFIWLVSFGFSSYTTYKRVYEDFEKEQVSLTTLSKKSLKGTFEQYEIMLNIVASQILKNDQVVDNKSLRSIMSAATKLKSSVMALGLFNLDGTVYVIEPINSLPKTGSIIDIAQSKDSFLAAANSDGMVVGRTYVNEALGKVIIPFRLAIRDSTGNVIFILSMAMDLKKGLDFFVKNSNEGMIHDTYLYRETDRYFQLPPFERMNVPGIYQYQISQEDIDTSTKRLVQKLKISLEEIKDRGVLFTDQDPLPSRVSQVATVFIKEYGIWLVTEIKLNKINTVFIKKVTIIVLVHLLSIVLIFILFRSIATSEKKKLTELEFQANHDNLTHLYNRYYLDRYLARLSHKRVFSLIYLNIDHFKAVNDSHGHFIGDQLLKLVATRIKSITKKNDLVTRFGGDEFVILSFNQTKEQTSLLCEKLLSSLSEPFKVHNFEIIISASIGVSLYPNDTSSTEEIKRNVDLAMSSAKKEKNTAVFFSEPLLHDYLFVCQVEQELKKSIINNELHMVYQPQFSEDGVIVGVEALIRWNNKTLGSVPPDKFIPIAESMGYMNEIGTFVISQTLNDMVHLQQKLGLKFSVSINVSVKQLNKPEFFDNLMQVVEMTCFPTELLILEVTETVLIDDLDAIQSLMVKIKQFNIRISLDDFGTGYSSLSILKNLPIDELKIDKSFIDDIINDEDTLSLVKGIVSIAKNMQIKTVAEGVETQEVLFVLMELECDIYQGYYFSKPIDKNQFELFLANRLASDINGES